MLGLYHNNVNFSLASTEGQDTKMTTVKWSIID